MILLTISIIVICNEDTFHQDFLGVLKQQIQVIQLLEGYGYSIIVISKPKHLPW